MRSVISRPCSLCRGQRLADWSRSRSKHFRPMPYRPRLPLFRDPAEYLLAGRPRHGTTPTEARTRCSTLSGERRQDGLRSRHCRRCGTQGTRRQREFHHDTGGRGPASRPMAFLATSIAAASVRDWVGGQRVTRTSNQDGDAIASAAKARPPSISAIAAPVTWWHRAMVSCPSGQNAIVSGDLRRATHRPPGSTTNVGSASKTAKRGAPIRCRLSRQPTCAHSWPKTASSLACGQRGRLAAAGLPPTSRSGQRYSGSKVAPRIQTGSNGTTAPRDAARTDPGGHRSKFQPRRPDRASAITM